MAFATAQKLQMIAAVVAGNLTYLKKTKSYFPQSEVKGKKYGMEMFGYLPDPGTVKHGIVADPDSVNQPKIGVVMDNANSSCELDLWDELVNVEDFKEEIAKPRGENIALTVQKDVMELNMFRSAQAVVATTANFKLLTDASSKLDELAVGGTKVCFQNPTTNGTIAEGGLSRFIESARMREIYEDAYLGQYAGAAQVSIPLTPTVNTTGMSEHPTVTATVIKDKDNNVIGLEAATTITGSGSIIPGVPYTVNGLKIRNAAGVETNQPYTIIVTKELTGVDSDKNPVYATKIPELRVTVSGKGTNNGNAWIKASDIAGFIAGSTATLILQPVLTAGKTYAVGQCRTESCLGFDQYKFDSLPGSNTQDVGTFEGFTLKLMEFGEGKQGVKLVRIDMTYAAKLYDHRESVTTYLQLD